MRRICLSVLCACTLRGAHAEEGPLRVRNPSLGHHIRHEVCTLSAGQFEDSEWLFDVGLSWANVWNLEVLNETIPYLVDGEWTVVSVGVARRLSDRLAVELSLPLVSRSGGFADGMIENFHDMTGVGSARREHLPRNETAVGFVNEAGETNLVRHGSTGAGDVTAVVSCDARRTDGAEVVFHAGVSLPTGDEREIEGKGAVGAFLGSRLGMRLGESRWWVHLAGQAGYADDDEAFDIEIWKEYIEGMLALEYRLERRASYVAQVQMSSPWAREELGQFADPSAMVTLGARWRIGRRAHWELGLTENILNDNSSADLALHTRAQIAF